MELSDPADYGNRPGDGPLRPNGVAMEGLPLGTEDLPSTMSPSAQQQAPKVALMRDVFGGTDRIRAGATNYLPKGPGEVPANYNNRLRRSVLFPALRRTVEGLVGLVFRKDPELADDVPPQIVEHWENIDLTGTHGDVFCRDLMADALTAGHAAILVDYPATGGTQSAAQEMEIRPYWVPIKKENIMSWRTVPQGGATILTQIVLKECTYAPRGMFGEVEQMRYRVLYRDHAGTVGFMLLEVLSDRRVIVVAEGLYPTQVEIPVAEITTSGRIAMFESDPPLLDLAHLDIAHYQQWSDYATSIHKTCVPVLFGAGLDLPDGGAEIVVGPDSSIMAPNPAARLEYVSHNGASLGASKAALDDLKSDMGTMGLAMLAPSKRVAETAEAKRLDKSTSDSALAVTARGLQDGLERALEFHARYLGLDSGGSIVINRDFENVVMDAQTMSAYAGLIGQGLPIKAVLDMLQAGGRLKEDVDTDELAMEMEAGQAAIAEQQRQAAEQAGGGFGA